MTDYWSGRDAGGFFERITTFCMLVDPLDAVVGWTGCHRTRFALPHRAGDFERTREAIELLRIRPERSIATRADRVDDFLRANLGCAVADPGRAEQRGHRLAVR